MKKRAGERFQNSIGSEPLQRVGIMLIFMPVEAVVEVIKSCLVVLTALFPIVNPLATSPIFLSLTPGYSSEARAILSRQIALNSFWLLTGSMLIGSHVLDFFGISIPVVQVGGGLVVISAGWRLLEQTQEKTRTMPDKKISCQDIKNRAFYPLTLPLTVGPGSISVAITLGADESPHRASIVRLIAALVGPALMAVTVYLCYRFAERLAKFVGETAMNVVIRLGSFILLCIGVQILWNGVRSLTGFR